MGTHLGSARMPFTHGFVPMGWARGWDAEAWDGAWLWHHPCTQEGKNLIWNLHLHAAGTQFIPLLVLGICPLTGGELQCIKAVY